MGSGCGLYARYEGVGVAAVYRCICVVGKLVGDFPQGKRVDGLKRVDMLFSILCFFCFLTEVLGEKHGR